MFMLSLELNRDVHLSTKLECGVATGGKFDTSSFMTQTAIRCFGLFEGFLALGLIE